MSEYPSSENDGDWFYCSSIWKLFSNKQHSWYCYTQFFPDTSHGMLVIFIITGVCVMCVYICVYMYLCVCMYVCVQYVCVCVYMYVCVCACMCVYNMCMCVCVCVYVCVCTVCVCVCVC